MQHIRTAFLWFMYYVFRVQPERVMIKTSGETDTWPTYKAVAFNYHKWHRVKPIIKESPLKNQLLVSNEMAFINLITELGYREDKMWTEEENELLSKLAKLAEEHTIQQIEKINQYIVKSKK